MKAGDMEEARVMDLSAEEWELLHGYCESAPPLPRFRQISRVELIRAHRDESLRALVGKKILARLAGGEYWLTERGLGLLREAQGKSHF